MPTELNGARVLFTAIVGPKVRPTRNTAHHVEGETLAPVQALAIGAGSNDGGFFLFYCNREWVVLTDTWHMTIANAMEQAEFEYAGIHECWRDVA
jgi:hypothetical protein